MATDLPRFTITLPVELYARVSEYQQEQKIKTQSKAIQKLIAIGIENAKGGTAQEEQKNVFKPSEIEKKYRALDEHGKKVVDLVMNAEGERVQAEGRQAQSVVIDLGMIRHYFYSPAAGPDGLIDNAGYEDIPRTAEMPKEADFCLTANGDSMIPYIEDGQMIFVQEDAQVAPGEIGVFFYQGGTYIKQFRPQSNGGVLLESANPERQNANVFVSADSLPWLVCFGKVIGLERNPKHGRL